MSIRGIGLILIVLCLLGGLIAAIFTPAIAATLSLPSGSTRTPSAEPTLVAGSQAQPTSQPTPLPGGVMVLAQDTFQRPAQRFWGTASDGRTWSGDANLDPAFTIANDVGQIAGGGGNGAMQALLGVSVNNAELLLSGSVDHFDANGDINLGGVLRWQDANTWYKLFINGTKLELLRDLHGTQHVLKDYPFQAGGGINYSLRFRAQGSYLFGKVWPSLQSEPANWSFMVIDTALTSGMCGVRVFLAPGALIRVNSFMETSVSIANDM